MPLGNSEAVKAANARERRPARPAHPAKEVAEKRAEVPERDQGRRLVVKPAPVDEFAEDLRRAIPGITDAAIAKLRKEFRK